MEDEVKIFTPEPVTFQCEGASVTMDNEGITIRLEYENGSKWEREEDVRTSFRTLAHNYFHMREMPHETVRRICRDSKDKSDLHAYVKYWADYLVKLSNLVRAEDPTEE